MLNNMSNKVIVAIVIVLLVILGLFIFKGDNKVEAPADAVATDEPVSNQTKTITANHYFANGVHTLEGTMTLPTPCHEIETNVVIAKSLPEQVIVNFRQVPGEGICVQTIADKFFRVTFSASENAKITATLGGEPVGLILSGDAGSIVK